MHPLSELQGRTNKKTEKVSFLSNFDPEVQSDELKNWFKKNQEVGQWGKTEELRKNCEQIFSARKTISKAEKFLDRCYKVLVLGG